MQFIKENAIFIIVGFILGGGAVTLFAILNWIGGPLAVVIGGFVLGYRLQRSILNSASDAFAEAIAEDLVRKQTKATD